MLFWIVLIALVGGFGYLTYKYGLNGAMAAVAGFFTAFAAWFGGVFDTVQAWFG